MDRELGVWMGLLLFCPTSKVWVLLCPCWWLMHGNCPQAIAPGLLMLRASEEPHQSNDDSLLIK